MTKIKLERLHSFIKRLAFNNAIQQLKVVKLYSGTTIKVGSKLASVKSQDKKRSPHLQTYILIYNPPKRVAHWSIESPISVRQGGVLCIPFRLVSFLQCFVAADFTRLFGKKKLLELKSEFCNLNCSSSNNFVVYTGFLYFATSAEYDF